jgi:hypothetical protein
MLRARAVKLLADLPSQPEVIGLGSLQRHNSPPLLTVLRSDTDRAEHHRPPHSILTVAIALRAMAGTPEKYARIAQNRLDVLKSHLSDVPAPAGRLTKLSRSLQGKKAIVTGAASGMGRETAKVLADEGVRVAILDLDQGGVQAVVDEINGVHPGRAQGWVCDVADRARIKQVCKEVIDTFGGLDVREKVPPQSLAVLK